jgi:hypothetical protein
VDMTIRGQHHNCTLPAREFPHNLPPAPSRDTLAVSLPFRNGRFVGIVFPKVSRLAGVT